MGNAKSLKESGDETRSLTTYIPGDIQDFDPSESYAVCVGVGELINYPTRQHDKCSTNDALKFGEVLEKKLGFEKINIKVLTPESETRPTFENIIDSMIKAAQSVGKKGLLVYTFSGHGLFCDDGIVLAAEDFGFTPAEEPINVVKATDIIQIVLSSCNAKYFMLVLDCCYAFKFLKKLDKLAGHIHSCPWIIVASCSAAQRSAYLAPLQHGIFSYFFLDQLQQLPKRNELRIQTLLDNCDPYCDAICQLMKPCTSSAGQKPECVDSRLVFSDAATLTTSEPLQWILTAKYGPQTPELTEHYPFCWFAEYILDIEKIRVWSVPHIEEWLRSLVPHLTTLKPYSTRSEMINTVMVLSTQSVVAQMYPYFGESQNKQCIFYSEYCVLFILQICDVLHQCSFSITAEAIQHGIMAYLNSVVQRDGIKYSDKDLNPLLDLLTKFLREQNIDFKHKTLQEDHADGSGENETEMERIVRLLKSMQVPSSLPIPESPT